MAWHIGFSEASRVAVLRAEGNSAFVPDKQKALQAFDLQGFFNFWW